MLSEQLMNWGKCEMLNGKVAVGFNAKLFFFPLAIILIFLQEVFASPASREELWTPIGCARGGGSPPDVEVW